MSWKVDEIPVLVKYTKLGILDLSLNISYKINFFFVENYFGALAMTTEKERTHLRSLLGGGGARYGLLAHSLSHISREMEYNSCMIMNYHHDAVDGIEFNLWLQ